MVRTGNLNPNWKGGISKDRYRYKQIQKQRYPDRIKAREAAAYAVKSGKIPKRACEICGNPNVQLHHDDYSRPLEIRFLCVKHHREYHQGIGVGIPQKCDKIKTPEETSGN